MKLFIKETEGYVSDLLTFNPEIDGYNEIEVESFPTDITNGCYRLIGGVLVLDNQKKLDMDAMTTVQSELGFNADMNTYDALVLIGIRKKYSLQQELAIARQKETKPVEWKEYYDYCEECKVEAKKMLYK